MTAWEHEILTEGIGKQRTAPLLVGLARSG